MLTFIEQRREEQQSVMRLEQSGLSHSQAVQQSSIKYKKNKIGHMRKFERAHKSEIHKRWKKAWKNGSQFSRYGYLKKKKLKKSEKI